MKTITVRIGLGKAPIVEAHGFAGVGCQAATEAFEQALGRVQAVELKPEAYEQPVSLTTDQTLGGAQ